MPGDIRPDCTSGVIQDVIHSGEGIQASPNGAGQGNGEERGEESSMGAERWPLARGIIDNMPHMAWMKDREGKFLMANQLVSEACGVEMEGLIGRTDLELFPEKVARKFMASDSEILASGNGCRLEEEWTDQAGIRRWFETIKSPMFDGSGRVVGTMGIAREITAEKRQAEELATHKKSLQETVERLREEIRRHEQTEQSLRESEQRFRDVMEMLPEIVFESDLSGNLRLLNNRGLGTFSYTQADFSEGVSITGILPPEERVKVAEAMRQGFGATGKQRRIEFNIKRKDGSTFPALVSVVPIIRDGRPAGLRGIVTDITEVKQCAAALAESEIKFKDLAEHSPVGVSLIQDGLFRYVNPVLASMHGSTPEEMIDKKGPADFGMDNEWPGIREHIESAIATDGKGSNQFRMRAIESQVRDCEARFSETVYRGRPAIIATVLDVTERRRAEERIRILGTLARELANPADLQEAIEACLHVALEASGMDGGAAYAADSETGDLNMVCAEGRLEGFAEVFSPSKADTELMRLLMLGNPIYEAPDYVSRLRSLFLGDGNALQLLVLPMLYEGALVACFCIASRAPKVLDEHTRSILEAIGIQIRGGLARVWAEAVIRKSAEKYWALLDGAPDAMLLADVEGIILEANKRAEEVFGYDKGEFLGKDFFELLRPVGMEKVRSGFRHLVEVGSVPIATIWMRRKDRKLVPVSVTASVVEFGSRRLVQAIFRDITARLQASRALRESEARYRTLMDNANDAILQLGEDGTILDSNKKASKLLGYTKEDLLGMHYTRLGPGLNSSEITATFEGKSADGILHECYVARMDGTLAPVDLSWNKVRVRGKSVVQVVIRSIRRRKAAEDALRESELRYRTVFENTGTAMAIFETDMTISFVNAEFERMSGYARAEIEGKKKWPDFVCDHVQHKGTAPLRCISSGNAGVSHEAAQATRPHSFRSVIAGRGGRTYVLVTVAGLPNSEGSVASLIDINPLVEAEHVLRQSEERYRALVLQSSEGIFVVEPKTKKVMEANEPFMNTLGYEADDIQHLSLYDLIMENKGFIDGSVAKVLQNGQYFMGERTFRGKNGVVDVDVAASSVSYGNHNLIVMSFRDITEKKQMEEALRQAQKMEAIGTLAGGIAHDFNNILQVIAGCAFQLTTKLKKSEDDQLAGLAQQVLKSSEKASQLTRSILTFSRKQPIDPKPINVNETILGMQKFLKRIIGEEIDLVPEYYPDNLLIMADQVQVEQVLMNVATNARDAMPNGGVLRISASVGEIGDSFVRSRGYGVPGAYACISVSDTGHGMDEETRKRIFEPFYTTKKAGKGTGLGMAVVYGIMKQHNGYIDVESEPGAGTTVRAYFPLAAITHQETRAAEESEAVTAGGGETILLAEDEQDVRSFLRGILEEAGYGIIEAENGEEAVELYTAHKDKIALVLLDVVMPKMNGKQAYDKIKKVGRGIKAIFMSGYSEETIHKKGVLTAGIVLLSKPVPPFLLLSKIKETLKS